ncbi:MAG TPA: RNase adapter RapZ [Gammaproteobacteria bacterium]|nr:RNase adapter RapZ [Gammaproteobacteria bacterium]
MNLCIVSGLSGSGKTIALNALEDEGYYCIDNLPVGLLLGVIENLAEKHQAAFSDVGVGIDARSGFEDLDGLGDVITQIKDTGHSITLIFLQADEAEIIKRYSETRRKHPLTHDGYSLVDAVREERRLLTAVAGIADLTIDTSYLNIHDLSLRIRDRVNVGKNNDSLSLLVQSFGFKHGAPMDSDFLFDLRCLPNPHWDTRIRPFTGKEKPVIDFLEQYEEVKAMFLSLSGFLDTWVPQFMASNRSYVTVSIGCTGGRHRSVYMVDRLGQHLRQQFGHAVIVKHRDL